MAKPNYQFEKRQRELEKKRKQEEKRQRDQAARSSADDSSEQALPDPPASTDADSVGAPD